MSKSSIEPLREIEIKQLGELFQIAKYNLRSKIVLFRDLGYEPKEIAVLLHCHIYTVWKYLKKWKDCGFEGLF